MRPVFRGEAPNIYTKYGEAIGDLEERLGVYCSYCERRFPASLEVEHVVPKSRELGLQTAWSNFLLGCKTCNTVKGQKETNEEDFLWPDKDNTLRAFVYEEGGFVRLAQNLQPLVQDKARQLQDLVGLDRHEAQGWPRPSRRDKRWVQRDEVWTIANRYRQTFDPLTDEIRPVLVDFACYAGFFSVWFAVFHNDPPFKRALVARFQGTAVDCFDAEGIHVPRPGGRL